MCKSIDEEEFNDDEDICANALRSLYLANYLRRISQFCANNTQHCSRPTKKFDARESSSSCLACHDKYVRTTTTQITSNGRKLSLCAPSNLIWTVASNKTHHCNCKNYQWPVTKNPAIDYKMLSHVEMQKIMLKSSVK